MEKDEDLSPPTPPEPDLGKEDLEHEVGMIWRFGAGADLGEVDLEHDVEMTWRFGAGMEMLEMENQVGQLERNQQVEKGWGEKGHQLQYSPGLAHAQ